MKRILKQFICKLSRQFPLFLNYCTQWTEHSKYNKRLPFTVVIIIFRLNFNKNVRVQGMLLRLRLWCWLMLSSNSIPIIVVTFIRLVPKYESSKAVILTPTYVSMSMKVAKKRATKLRRAKTNDKHRKVKIAVSLSLPCQIESFAYTANADGNNNVRAEVISEMSGVGLARNSGWTVKVGSFRHTCQIPRRDALQGGHILSTLVSWLVAH